VKVSQCDKNHHHLSSVMKIDDYMLAFLGIIIKLYVIISRLL